MAILLVGASGLARETLPVLRELDRDVVGVLDDRAADDAVRTGGLPVLGTIDDVVEYPDAELVICVGSSRGRAAVLARLLDLGISEDRLLTVLDPSVRNPAGVPIGAGSILLANVTVTADAAVGRCVVAMPGVTVTHDCDIADVATLAAGVSLGGGVRIGRAAYLGMNSSVHPGVAIGREAVVGMGAVVLSDVPDGQTWAGVPARALGGSQ